MLGRVEARGFIPCNSGSWVKLYGNLLPSISLNVIEILGNKKGEINKILFVIICYKLELNVYLLDGTPGTQCLAISAPLPFKMSTDLYDINGNASNH